jgi:hypothetical protein
VEVPLEGDEGVAGGGGDVLGVDFGFLGNAQFVVQGADGFEGVGLVVGQVAVDGLEGEVGVGLKDMQCSKFRSPRGDFRTFSSIFRPRSSINRTFSLLIRPQRSKLRILRQKLLTQIAKFRRERSIFRSLSSKPGWWRPKFRWRRPKFRVRRAARDGV